MIHLKKKKKFIWPVVFFFISLTLLLPNIVYGRYIVDDITSYKEELELEGINRAQWSLGLMKDVGLGLTRMMVGIPALEGEERANYGGAAGVFAGLIDGMYQNKPVSSVRYFAYLKKNLNIVKPAYAQGKGWQFLNPILKIWTAVRDLAYLFFVVIFVTVGFMIMFRKKIDPQTVVSIQNALPKIILSLVLVTFSYAICGLVIDLAFLSTNLLGTIFKPLLLEISGTGEKIFELDPALDIIRFLPQTAEQATEATGFLGILWGFITGLLGSVKDILGGDFSAVFFVVIAFVFISSVIKIFLSLLRRYVMLFLYTIISPFMFLWGSLPGQSDHISRLFKSLLSSAITFPVIFLMLQLVGYFSAVSKYLAFETITPFNIPVPADKFAQSIGSFIGLGILMSAGKIPEAIDDLLQVKPSTAAEFGTEAAGALRRIPIIGGLVG